MGLLTDTKQRQALLRAIVRYHQKLSILLYLVGLAWFFALAYRPFNAGTYFSENALLPGLSQFSFSARTVLEVVEFVWLTLMVLMRGFIFLGAYARQKWLA